MERSIVERVALTVLVCVVIHSAVTKVVNDGGASRVRQMMNVSSSSVMLPDLENDY